MTTVPSADEGENSSGPNNPSSYDIQIEVAPGQTLDNVSIDYVLPENFVFLGVSDAGGGTVDTTNLGQTVGGDFSDDVLTIDFATLSGNETITFDFFVDELGQDGTPTIDPNTGLPNNLSEANNVTMTYDWDTTDARDTDLVGEMEVSTGPSVEAKSLAITKAVSIVGDTGAAGATPGDTLEYTLNISISDFFAFDTLTVEDVFDDGQLLTGTPELTVVRQGVTEGPYSFTTDFTDTVIAGDDHQLNFNISDLLATNLVSGVLEGGKFDADDLGQTTLTITYQAIIQDSFVSEAGNLFIKQGDVLGNDATVSGRLLDNTLSAIGPFVTDDSSASVTVPNAEVDLSIYALNGSTSGDLTQLTPGDDVTFRLQYDLITGDFEDFQLEAFLPQPIFSLLDINDDGTAGENFILDNGTLIPTVGDFRYGPTATSDVTSGVPSPTPILDTTSNAVTFDFGDLSDPTNDGGKIDILFTIRVTDVPFADGLTLTTLSQQEDSNSPGTVSISNDLTQVVINQPNIDGITKGVVSTDNSAGTFDGGTPSGFKTAGDTDANPLSGTVNSTNLDSLNLDSDLSDVDAGDIVRFAIIVENDGNGPNGAFDVTISDTLPAGFIEPAGGINLRVVNGAGTVIGVDNVDPDTDLFAGGITLTDGATGALGVNDPTNGQNIVIITYDLEVASTVEAVDALENTATLTNYANVDGGDDFTSIDPTDTATVTTAGASVNKAITDTNQAHTSGNEVVVSEVVEYTVTIDIPEGLSSSAMLVDTLDAGLAFVGVDSITFSSADITSTNGTTADILNNDVSFANVGGGVDNDGRRVTIDFGDVTNANDDNATTETVTIVYSAIVVNTSATNSASTHNNNATWTTTNDSDNDNAPNVTVVEPVVNVSITPDVTEVDTGDTVTWTVVITAPAANDANAFDVDFNNSIPAGLTYVGGSAMNTAGEAPDSFSESGGDFNAVFNSLTPGETATFTFQTTVDSSAAIGDDLQNSGTVTWQSHDGALGDVSPHTTVDTERTGDGGINDYTTTANGQISILFEDPSLTIDDTSEVHTTGTDVTIGEIVRFRFEMRIPESTTADFRVEPQIPAGLQFIDDGTATVAFISNGGLSVDGAGLAGNGLVAGDQTTVSSVDPSFVIPTGLIAGGPFTEGDNPQFRLGELTNADNDANQEFIVIEFNALVVNEPTVNDGDTLTTGSDVLSGTTALVSTNDVDVNVEEPVLSNLNKEAISTDGSTATFEITFDNTSGLTAFDVSVLETLPANLSNLQNVTVTPSGGVTGITDNSTGTDLDVDITDFPDGGSVTITFTADVTDASLPVASNDVDVTWTSTDGAASSLTTVAGVSTVGAAGTTTGERTGSTAPVQNDYTISDDAGLSVMSGSLFEDVDGDNVKGGGEAVLDNTRINLIYAGPDGIFGNGDDQVFSTLTDVNGDYSFGALPSGDYQISVQPNGLTDGLSDDFKPKTDASGSNTDNLIELTLGDGVTSTDNNFGLELQEPPAGADNVFNVVEDTPITFAPGDFGFTDPNAADTLAAVRIDNIPDPATEGALTLNGVPVTPGQIISAADIGDLVFTPAADISGVPLAIFDFSVQDDTGRFDPVPNTITVNVTSVPDDPTGTDNEIQITENTSHTFSDSDFGFGDVDGDAFDNVRIDTLPERGTLTLNGVPVTPGQVIAVGDISDLVFTPEPGENALSYASFDFSVQDDTGAFDSVPNTINLDVTPLVTVAIAPPVDKTPIPGSGTVFGAPATDFSPTGGDNPQVDPITGIRILEVGGAPFSDINFDIDISKPDFWIAGGVDQKLMIETKEMAFQVPKTIFRHSNPGEPLTFEAELSDGSPLPDWMSFDSGDLSFKGTPPLGAPKALEIVVIATDTKNNEVKAPVRVLINREVDGDEMPAPENEEAQGDASENDEGNKNQSEEVEDNRGSSDQNSLNEQPENSNMVYKSFSDQVAQHSRQAEIETQKTFIKVINT